MSTSDSSRLTFSNSNDVEALPVTDKREEYGDADKTGLRVRVSPSGKKTFIWRVRYESKQRVVIVGDHPATSVNQARVKLDDKKQSFADGSLFVTEQKRKSPTTVRQLVSEYMAEATKDLSEGRKVNVQMAMDKYVLPAIGSAKLRSLKAPQVKVAVMKAVNLKHNARAEALLGIVKRLFRYAEAHGYIEHSPAAALEKSFCGIKKQNSREGKLDAESIPLFWSALNNAQHMSEPVRVGLRILMLSGVRSGELRQAKWQEVDFEKAEWNIPAKHSKTKAWTVLLPAHLLAQFKLLETLTGDTDFLFPGRRGNGPITDKVFVKAMERMFAEPDLAIDRITPHDFRRTMRTTMAEDLNIADSVAEACLNHEKGKVESAYNKAQLLKQRHAALNKWGNHVDLLVNPRDNVTVLSNAG